MGRTVRSVLLSIVLVLTGVSCAPFALSPEEDEPPAGEPKPGIVEIPETSFLRITHVNVGQGDATLVEGPERTLLIDGGDNGMGNDRVIRVLQEYGIPVLDYVVATHPHADHIGGLDEVFDRADVTGGVWDNGQSATTQSYESYVEAAERTSGGRHTIAPGHVFDLGSGVTVTCYASNGVMYDGYVVANATGTNDRSVVLVIEWGAFREVIAGDLGGYDTATVTNVESSLGWLIGDVDVLRVSHHGSRYSTNPEWLNELAPEVAVISNGDGNDYGHPSADTLGRLTGQDAAVTVPSPDLFLTEKGAAPSPYAGSGDVVVFARPSWYEVEYSRYDATVR